MLPGKPPPPHPAQHTRRTRFTCYSPPSITGRRTEGRGDSPPAAGDSGNKQTSPTCRNVVAPGARPPPNAHAGPAAARVPPEPPPTHAAASGLSPPEALPAPARPASNRSKDQKRQRPTAPAPRAYARAPARLSAGPASCGRESPALICARAHVAAHESNFVLNRLEVIRLPRPRVFYASARNEGRGVITGNPPP